MRHLLAFVLLASCVGCSAAPPALLDATPRFRVGQERSEGIEAFAEVETIVKDFPTHFGLMWDATVVDAGPSGATIDAKITRVVAQLPGDLLTIDTDSLIPLGRLLGLGRILFKLTGLGFRYSVSPTGDVRLSGWSKAVDSAATAAGEVLPGDGQIPPSQVLEDALERVYRSAPRRTIALNETWTRPEEYRLSTEKGPPVNGTADFGYVGMGKRPFRFGDDELELEGASVKFNGACEVTEEGEMLLGVVPVQRGGRRGQLLFSRDGGQILMYRELDELKIRPRLDLGDVELSADLASLKTGWLFFAESPWE